MLEEQASEHVEVDESTSTPPVEVHVSVPDVPEAPPPEVPEVNGEPGDQTRDMELGTLRATLEAHMTQQAEDEAECENRLTALEMFQTEMTQRFSDELQMIRSEIAEVATRPIAEVVLPPPPAELEGSEDEQSQSDVPLAERPLDEAAGKVLTPIRNALPLQPNPPRRLRRRRG